MALGILERPKSRKPHGKPVHLAESAAPLLDNGYRLAQPEFHRRYELTPQVKKVELIEGIVFMGSPVSVAHAEATGNLAAWLGMYRAATPGVRLAENATLVLDMDNEFQPDLMLRLEESRGGQSQVIARYLHGVPELIAEVAVSSVAHDLHAKLNVYRRMGVPEYLVWQIEENRMDWFAWRDGKYVPMSAAANGQIHSGIFAGLWLDAAAMLAGDLKKVLHQLQRGLDSPEHRQFLRRLASK